MTKFIAKQPTSNQILAGLTILANPNGVRFDNIEGNGFTATPQSGTIRIEIGGHGFQGSFGRPKAEGTVNSIKYTANGTLIYMVKGAKYAFENLAESNDAAKHTEAIFARDDVIKGSFGGDPGLYGFKGNDKLDGKEGNDSLFGGAGKDSLAGGAGYDSLDGGKGKDTYVFKSDPTTTGYDTIVKFEEGENFELKAKYFAGLVVGELSDDQFVIGPAVDAEDRIAYDPTTGFLTFDPDGGTAPTQPIIFAKIQPNVDHLTAADFLII